MSEPAPYVHQYQVGWWDTDAARIAYTARFPQFAMEAMDGWFRARLGTHWFALTETGRGTPFVHMSLDMRAPLTPDDTLATTVLLERAGRSALHFRLLGRRGDGALSFEGRFVCAFVRIDGLRAIPIPSEFRDAVAAELRRSATYGAGRPIE